MKSVIQLLIAVAALGLFAARPPTQGRTAEPEGPDEIHWSNKLGDDVVPAERPVLYRLNASTPLLRRADITALDITDVLRKDADNFAPYFLQGLNDIAKLEGLADLRIRSGPSDECLAIVAKIPNLRHLTFSSNKLSAAGMAKLANLHSLESLTVSGISDEAMGGVSRLNRLTMLDISLTKVSTAAPKSIEGLTNLEVLCLPSRPIADADLEHLEKLVKIRRLPDFARMGVRGITDRGAAYLRNMTEMEELDLTGLRLTDEGLRNLRGMTKLRSLNLRLTGESVAPAWLAWRE